ncbi:hypothetical protein QQ020_25805 [Fulvivirgaceae bacterium BMA12]|uniref:Penicillin-binding protein n=1 Tax=Agaribacillus aureus TaxID=3051825 RepID=A0ABT8LCK9_9BACT|nr:hypothetical protein [Fulvivirgaceae bacterium BMA12]
MYGHSGSTSRGFQCNFSLFQDINMGYVMFTNGSKGAMLAISPLTEFLITGKE